MIICLEGPSAVGKTTTCSALAEQMGAFVVPEVNALFECPAQAEPDWYLERQVERWAIAQKHSENGELVILDGDVFQPLWYNWSFGFAEYQPLGALSAFYRPRIETDVLGFPDHYVHLSIDENKLRLRKEADQTRTRRGFDANLRLLQTQPRYFGAMSRLAPGLVHPVEAESVEANLRSIRNVITSPVRPPNALGLFDGLIDWLRSNKAELTCDTICDTVT